MTLTQEREVGGWGADELDEWLPQLLREAGPRHYDVGKGEEGEEKADPTDLQELQDHVHLAKAGQTLVPDGGQQLLYVRVGHKLKANSVSIVFNLGCITWLIWMIVIAIENTCNTSTIKLI